MEYKFKFEDFKIGDIVIVKNNYHISELVLKIGKIIFFKYSNNTILIKFDKHYPNITHSAFGRDPSHSSRYLSPDNIELYDKKKIKLRIIEKEKMKIKMMEIDPFGEENWINEKSNIKNLKTYKEFNKV
jgi:hypothetical protein